MIFFFSRNYSFLFNSLKYYIKLENKLSKILVFHRPPCICNLQHRIPIKTRELKARIFPRLLIMKSGDIFLVPIFFPYSFVFLLVCF